MLVLTLTFVCNQSNTTMSRFYDVKINTLAGKPFNMQSLKGKKLLLVNTASECGFTPQYAQLEELHEMYGGEHFCVVGIPCNDFGGQEPGKANDIEQFCQTNYGVTFTMLEKVKITGANAHELYKWLTNATENGVLDANVKWNFHKFLIDENGNVVKDLPSAVMPLDDEILNWVK